jgi:hypothetical protein
LEYYGNNINSIVKSLSFGEVILSKTEKNIYWTLNSNFISLCRTLPDYMQNPAMIFLLDYFSIKVSEPVDFMYYYYKPLWTIIPRIMESPMRVRELTSIESEAALLGEAMSLFLHSLDDHLNDGEIPSSHLMLLLRSQAWLLFNKAITGFEYEKDEHDIAHLFINDYYTGICTEKEPSGLDEYCNRFRKEMSTMNIFPLLSAKKITGSTNFTEKIKNAIESFGIAWRILDDLQDTEEDITARRHTALYHSLPENIKNLWDAPQNNASENSKTDIREEIYLELKRGRIAEELIKRIIRELDEAQKTVEALGMYGMAEQYREIGAPVRKCLKELKNVGAGNAIIR